MRKQLRETCFRRRQRLDDCCADGIAHQHVRCTQCHRTLRCERSGGGLFRRLCLGGWNEDGCYLLHHAVTAYRTTQTLYRFGFHASLSEGSTTRKTAAAAVGTGQYGLYQVDARVFLHRKLTSNHIQQDGCYQSCQS